MLFHKGLQWNSAKTKTVCAIDNVTNRRRIDAMFFSSFCFLFSLFIFFFPISLRRRGVNKYWRIMWPQTQHRAPTHEHSLKESVPVRSHASLKSLSVIPSFYSYILFYFFFIQYVFNFSDKFSVFCFFTICMHIYVFIPVTALCHQQALVG